MWGSWYAANITERIATLRIFIASHSREEALSLATLLEGQGHNITARWIKNDTKFGEGVSAYTDSERRALALMDEEDVTKAECVVLIAEPTGRNVPGGKHVETGIALALGHPVFVLGRRENVFHWHPGVTVLSGSAELLEALARGVTDRVQAEDQSNSR